MIHLGSVHLITDRPGATPAPTPQPQPTPGNPFPAPWPGGPCVVEVKACCGGITGDWCTCTCDTTKDRIELAFAPVLWRAA